jgi:pyridoxine kinase
MKNPNQKVAAIHDLSGFGRASLTVVIPVISAMGIQVCPLPTAVLSTHSKFSNYHFVDLTDHMKAIIDHWKALKISFDAIYSGFLGSHRQIEIVRDFIHSFQRDDQLVLVDPVLGDDGRIYSPLSMEMVDEMRDLVRHAAIITPNLTEVNLLLNDPYDIRISEKEIKDKMKALSDMGPEIVIATSIPVYMQNNMTSVIAYNRNHKRFWKLTCNYLPAHYPGTGDTFASVVLGALLQGDSLPMAIDRAVHFISMGVRATFGYDYNSHEGILLERVLNTLNLPVQISTYEIME